VLAAGLPVLLDATFLKRVQRQGVLAVGSALGVPCRILALHAPPELLRQRVQQRMARGGDPSEADGAVLERQLQQREPLDATEQVLAVQVDTRAPVDWAAVLPADWLREAGPRP
jgi:predicted kinase